jgi:type IX secretion system PorP/SprF family membrane protein
MRKQILALTVACLGFIANVCAQQEKLITHFIFDKMSINPGSTGHEDGICGTMIYRNQWDRVAGAPNSVLFNGEANLQRYFPVNVGLSMYGDAIGFQRQVNALLNVSYPLEIPDIGTLGIGLGIGIMNFGFNNASWVPPTTPVAQDPSIPAGPGSTTLDLNAGLFFKGVSDYYVGLSSTHLTEPVFKNNFFSTKRHYFIMGGKKFTNLFGNGMSLDIQALGRTEIVKFSADLNARFIYDQPQYSLYGGVTYRTSDALAFMFGLKWTLSRTMNFGVGYSYDLTTNKLATISRGTNELLGKFCYFIPKPPKTTSKHPRWL